MLNNLRYRFAMFMQGRYGTDALNRFLSGVIIALILISMFVRGRAGSILGLAIWALIIYMYYRTFSRDISRRYAENQKFLSFSSKLRTKLGRGGASIPYGTGFRNVGGTFDFRRTIEALKQRAAKRKAQQEANAGYRIFVCPKCSQKIRIPKGKGKIMVRCPKCGEEFAKRT